MSSILKYICRYGQNNTAGLKHIQLLNTKCSGFYFHIYQICYLVDSPSQKPGCCPDSMCGSQVTPLCNTEKPLCQQQYDIVTVDTVCLALLNFSHLYVLDLKSGDSQWSYQKIHRHWEQSTPIKTHPIWPRDAALRWMGWKRHIICTTFCKKCPIFPQTVSHGNTLKDDNIKKMSFINHNISHPALTHTLTDTCLLGI